jgi:signal transduction histidine kinase
MRFSLTAQLVAALAVVALVIGIVGARIVVRFEGDRLATMLTVEIEQRFTLFALSLKDDVISEDLPRLETNFRDFVQMDASLLSVHLANEQKRSLFTWRRPLSKNGSDEMLRLSMPISHGGELFGTVSAEWSMAPIHALISERMGVLAIAFTTIAGLIALFGYWAVSAFAIKPIGRIVQQLREFRDNRFDRVAPLSRLAAREIADLDRAANALGDFLKHRERREAELHAARDAAEAANRTKSAFLANMSHELRTPLNAIIGFSELIQMQTLGPLGNAKYLEYLHDIHLAGQRLLSVVNDILDLARVEMGGLKLEVSNFSLKPILGVCLTAARGEAKAKRIDLREHLPAHLPALIADELKLKQAVSNILSNAVKFTPEGGRVTMTVEWHPTLGIAILIADTGDGIPADKLESVLVPFGQADISLARKYEGTGLGLPLAKAFVELQGGALTLKSEVGVGTEVRITLPPDRLALDTPAEPSVPPALPGVDSPGLTAAARRRILEAFQPDRDGTASPHISTEGRARH